MSSNTNSEQLTWTAVEELLTQSASEIETTEAILLRLRRIAALERMARLALQDTADEVRQRGLTGRSLAALTHMSSESATGRRDVSAVEGGPIPGREDPFAFGLAAGLTVLAAEVEGLTPLDDVRGGDRPTEQERAADLLRRSHVLDRMATTTVDSLQGAIVLRMRGLGQAWVDIGTALGMSGQGAAKKAREKGWVVAKNEED